MTTTKATAFFVASVSVALGIGATHKGFGQVASKSPNASRMAPSFQADPNWPKLPYNWVTGMVASVAVGPNDHVWVIHRPRMLEKDLRPRAAPHVMEFDENGNYVTGWGGDGMGYDWPAAEHGITVDYKGNVWITGANPNPPGLTKTQDNMVLKFTNKGAFLMQIGGRGMPGGNDDTKNVAAATDVAVYEKTNEVFVADGYTNRRVIVFDADTGAFKRMWGAFGKPPDTRPPGGARPQQPLTDPEGLPEFNMPVHGVQISNDGLVYVSDRSNARVQVFTPDGKYVTQVFINRNLGQVSAARVAFSADPQQTYLYVGDYGNSRLVVLDRKTLEVLYQFGEKGAAPGQFQGLHHMTSDHKGNLYTAEVAPGNRVQRFLFKGIAPVPAGTGTSR
jgi:DNA-binding beta-propeller fold protein YncE